METNTEKIKKESKTGLTSAGLVNHILENHKIDIHDVDSVTLLNMGYYHGYKRYRFVKKSNSDGILSITSFEEIVAIYNFDMELKGLFYPIVMLVETALKNRVIDSLVAESSSGIEDILDNQLACYEDYAGENEKYGKKFVQYNETKQNILDTIEYYSDKNEVIKHYLDSNYQIPLWAYFEVITLGQFSRFLGCLTKLSREKLNRDFTIIPKRSNSLELVVNSLIELRNATMHNSAIFDANFSSGVSRVLKIQIKQDLKLSTFTCVFIEDYFILLIWTLNLLKFDSIILDEYINQFNEIVERFDDSLNNRDIFFKIISTNRKTSIQQLSKFIDEK
ncbi:DNA-binding protein [Streptococcus anginosus]|uniref:Abi family protein n=1 Tax=Streptococcus anginosus TaxID=1328 RepID=UPI000D02D1AD|nr:Abi family protein [Streptococcus anginosus]MCY7232532.1 Abi family protein [Streptococcus anginosus]PRT62755.1 DNA-binding protein [Streptococcus anginosus]